MKNLTVGTWNMWSRYILSDKTNYKLDSIIQLLEDYQLDVLALQEVSPIFASKLDKKLKKLDTDYVVTSRLDKSNNPIKNLTMDANIFISRLPYLKSKKIVLPSFPTRVEDISDLCDIKDRNVVYQDFIIGNESIRFYNTNLSLVNEELNMEQFDVIYNSLIKNQLFGTGDSLLCGTLNVRPKSYNMDYYRTMLASVGMKIVENDYRTYKKDINKVVDYIIIPYDYDIEHFLCVDSYDKKISAHNPLIVKIKK